MSSRLRRRRSSASSGTLASIVEDEQQQNAEWEVRPCGMLVQKRDPDEESTFAGPLIRVKVTHGLSSHYVSIKAHASFGDLKKALVQDTGLQPEQQRLLYKGKETKNRDSLHEAGLKDKSKLVLVEDKTGWEKRLLEIRRDEAAAKARKAVAEVQKLVDKLSGQVVSLETTMRSGKNLSDAEFVRLTDLFMCQLVKLDDSKVDGEVQVQKKILIRRVQKYVEALDALKAKNEKGKTQNDVQKHQNGSSLVQLNESNMQSAAERMKMPKSDASSNTANTSRETFVISTAGMFSTRPTLPVAENLKNTRNLIIKAPPVSEPLLIQWD